MVLIIVSNGYSIEKGMFPRVTNPSAARSRRTALDLHVLGVPPAFVLSQDQTLKLKASCDAILDVRPMHITNKRNYLTSRSNGFSFVLLS